MNDKTKSADMEQGDLQAEHAGRSRTDTAQCAATPGAAYLYTRCDGQVAAEGQHGWQVALAVTQVPQQQGVLAQQQQQG